MYGARLFNVMEAVAGKQVEIKRLPGIGKVRRNDVIVFNYPCPKKWRQIEMDVMQYYVKRCVALPGDTFCIVSGRYKVNGYAGTLGCGDAQDRFMTLIREQGLTDDAIGVRAYPGDSLIRWTVKKHSCHHPERCVLRLYRGRESVLCDGETRPDYRLLMELQQAARHRRNFEYHFGGAEKGTGVHYRRAVHFAGK